MTCLYWIVTASKEKSATSFTCEQSAAAAASSGFLQFIAVKMGEK